MNSEDTSGNRTCAPRMNLANEKLYLRQPRMLARMCPTTYKAWPENDNMWIRWMDGWFGGWKGRGREGK